MKYFHVLICIIYGILICPGVFGAARNRRQSGGIGFNGSVSGNGGNSVAGNLGLLLNFTGNTQLQQAVQNFTAQLNNTNAQIQQAIANAINQTNQANLNNLNKTNAFLQNLANELSKLNNKTSQNIQTSISNLQSLIANNTAQLKNYFNSLNNSTQNFLNSSNTQFNNFFNFLASGLQNLSNSRPTFQVGLATNNLLNLLGSGKLNSTINSTLSSNPSLSLSSTNFAQFIAQLQKNSNLGGGLGNGNLRTLNGFFNYLGNFGANFFNSFSFGNGTGSFGLGGGLNLGGGTSIGGGLSG